MMYRSGRGVNADAEQAWSLLTKACAAGDALGCAELSVLYLDDDGLRRDAAHAAELARAACDSTEGHGCAYLADLCLDRIIYPDGPEACTMEAVRQLRTKAVGALAYDCTGWNAYDCDHWPRSTHRPIPRRRSGTPWARARTAIRAGASASLGSTRRDSALRCRPPT
jgi:hypothetical protein